MPIAKLKYLVANCDRKFCALIYITLEQAMKAQRGSRGIALLFL
jgi:hypothetical protein